MTAAQIRSRPDAGAAPAAADPDLSHLRRLILADERREIAALRAELSRLDRRLGTDDRFHRAVADSLVVALKVVEIESHRELAAAMAPLVVSGIRREIEHSREMMVETLYPITGRMVSAGIGAMFRQLSEDINRKLETALSPKQFQLRIKAAITRRPLSELILAEAGRGRIERLLLIERATGAVIATTGPDGVAEAEPDATLHLLGGLVSAIVEFAGQALGDVRGELRQLDFGGQTVLLRASPLYVVAAIGGNGSATPGRPAVVDGAFLEFLDALHAQVEAEGADAGGAALAALHGTLSPAPAPAERKKPGVSPLAIVAVLLALGLAALAGRSWWVGREQARDAATLSAIARMPALMGYPVRLVLDREAGVIRADGVVPVPAVAKALEAELAHAFPDRPVDARLAVLSETPLARETDVALRRAEAHGASLETALADLGERAAADRTQARQDIARLVAGQSEAAADRAALREAQGRGERTFGNDLTDLRAAIVQADGRVKALGSATAQAASRDRAALRNDLAEIRTRVDGLDGETRRRAARDVETTRAEIATLGARLDTPLKRLEETVRATAAFFDGGGAYRDAGAAQSDLARLASALGHVAGARLRVVGYGDGSGTSKANAEAARMRTERVVADLKALGVAPERLIPVTTRPPHPIAAEAAGANRRVVFELAFPAQ